MSKQLWLLISYSRHLINLLHLEQETHLWVALAEVDKAVKVEQVYLPPKLLHCARKSQLQRTDLRLPLEWQQKTRSQCWARDNNLHQISIA